MEGSVYFFLANLGWEWDCTRVYWLVRWESVCLCAWCMHNLGWEWGENGPWAGELPACAQSRVRIRWEWASSSENGCWSLFALTQPSSSEPNEPAACNTFPLSMYSTTCKWFLQQDFKTDLIQENAKTDNLDTTDLYPVFRVWRLAFNNSGNHSLSCVSQGDHFLRSGQSAERPMGTQGPPYGPPWIPREGGKLVFV